MQRTEHHYFLLPIRLILSTLIAGLSLLYSQSSFAQISEAQARAMLADRGIPEDTLRARLMRKGYDLDNISPGQVPEIQTVILETIEEIEGQQQSDSRETSPTPALTDPAGQTEPPNLRPEPPTVPAQPVETNSSGIYGHAIFSSDALTPQQRRSDLLAPDLYVLGPGDKLGIIGFGKSEFEHILPINADGFVNPGQGLPRILLKGISFEKARELLFQRYSQFYSISRAEFQVTLQEVRDMTINVLGEVKVPGSYTLPAVNTAFNLIKAAGGPTDVGSLRQIRIIRGNETIPLDVYEFMADPSVAGNFFLQHNDYIHIPVVRKMVTIQGAVVRPMKYELLEAENLSKLIEFAGGAKPNAYLGDVKVTRYAQDKKLVANINWRELMSSGGDYILYNGDIIEIKSVEQELDPTVRIEGAVRYPGSYELKDEMRVSDLLGQSILKTDARRDFAYLLRYDPDGTYQFERLNLENAINNRNSPLDPVLQTGDVVHVLTRKIFADVNIFYVEGAVRQPRQYQIATGNELKLADAIVMSGGLLPEASDLGYVVRQDPRQPVLLEYIPIKIADAIENPNSAANIQIQSGDRIRVFDQKTRTNESMVAVFGAVRSPGSYPYGPGMTLADLVNLAGGMTYSADFNRLDIARIDFDVNSNPKIRELNASLPRDFATTMERDNSLELQPYDHIYVRTIPEFELQQTVRIDGEVKYPGTYPILKDKERISELIQRAGGITGKAFPEGAQLYRNLDSTGLVVIDLEEILRNQAAATNIVLRAGDVIRVPKSQELVTIEGYVNLQDAYSSEFLGGDDAISVAFRGERSAKYYVDEFAGGVHQDGSKRGIKVHYADGGVKKTKKFLWFNNYPKVKRGATILVGAKKIKPPVEKPERPTDWSTILRDTVAGATAVLTLLILVDQLNK